MSAELELTILQAATDDCGDVAGFALTDQMLIAVGGQSNRQPMVLASSNARQFEARKTPRELGLRDVLAVGDAVWTCGEYGQLAVSRDHGASWALVETGIDGCLYALALGGDGSIWCTGDDGYAARVVDDRAVRIDMATTTRLSSVYPMRDEIIVLGFDGKVRRWRNGTSTEVGTGATRPLTALAITRTGTWVVVGDGGFIARSPDGSWFSRVKCNVEVDLEGIASLPDGRLVIVGDRGHVLVSSDDGRTWKGVRNDLGLAHLWSVERFGGGVLIGGDEGLIVKLAPIGDATWADRVNVFGEGKPLDAAFANGPIGFIDHGLDEFLGAPAAAHASEPRDPDDELSGAGTAADFRDIYGVPLPREAERFFAKVAGYERCSTFEEFRLDHDLRPDVGDKNLFELMLRRNQQAYLGTDLVEAFCGVFGIGSQGNGDTYHMEIYEWDGPRQVLHFDHESHAFSGVFADSLDSLVYLSAIVKASADKRISHDAFEMGIRRLHGRLKPTWHFSIEDKDPEFVMLEPKRRDTEFFFYRSRWICALLQNDGVTDVDDVPGLFMADLNQTTPSEQLPARYEACEKFIPTALYAMWRAYLFDEPELDKYLEIARVHGARLVRGAARLIDELRGGRNELGTIKDVRAWLAAFRALDLDPRRAPQRAFELEASAKLDADRKHDASAELAATPRAQWADLAWRWVNDGAAHRALLEELDRDSPGTAALIAALDELGDLHDDEREAAVARLASELTPELEALLVGSLLRDDQLVGVLTRPPTAPVAEEDLTFAGEMKLDSDDRSVPDPERVIAALAMTERALLLAPDDSDIQFTHAMLLLDGERAELAGKAAELLTWLPRFGAPVRINVAVRLGKRGHALFGEVVDLALGASLSASAFDDVPHDQFSELGDAILRHEPTKLAQLVSRLPDDVNLLSALAWKAIQAEQRDAALSLYDRLLALAIPDDGDERTNYLRAMNNACVQAHSAQAFDAAVRIADRAQPVAHENPYIFHSAACAYAAIGDLPRALAQVKLAMEHDYDHVGKIEVDVDLGPLLESPEFKTLFRDWHARQEGN